MRRATVLLTAAAAALLALPLPTSAAPPARAAASTGPVLTSVALSTGAVTVKGLDLAPVTVTVTATGDQGACPGDAGGVTFRRTNIHVWDRSAPGSLWGLMSCVSDSGGVRTYRAVVPVPSTADGSWRVDDVNFANMYFQDPRTFGLPDATLGVTGTHRPRLRIRVKPQPLVTPARDVVVTVQASYDDDRTPVTTRWISLTDAGRSPRPCAECPGNTDAKGRLVRTVKLTYNRSLLADMPVSAPGFYDYWASYSTASVPIVVEPELSASPAKSSAPHGTDVAVDGRAVATGLPFWDYTVRIRVDLQRLVGRHWRTVSSSTIRNSGRFTLLATPPKGRNYYRVSLPAAQHDLTGATSRTFVIRGR